ncbi:MAG: alpha/beta hydrolase [Methanomicrobiales archaeon HGW-Methanomicrobiales-3]|jgi:pimeloyl-ACP methyl ester carboxylesterase|nr:MAG: alpha/beta hydrolase [Methanomicrobiales archaeon HGW-Methanomicrobiales-3]
MADYVLVHGGNMTTETWNRLTTGSPVKTTDGTMGGRIWDPVIPALHAQGHRAFAPTLADEHTTTLTGHIGEIEQIICGNNLRDVILAGHSYGGMVITGVAARLADRVRHMVYVDAAVPDPGQSLFDLIIASGSDPQSFAGLEPAPPYTEKLQFDARAIQSLQKTYIRCTKSDFTAVTDLARLKIAASGAGWSYLELPTSHVPMAEMPDRIGKVLLDAAEK